MFNIDENVFSILFISRLKIGLSIWVQFHTMNFRKVRKQPIFITLRKMLTKTFQSTGFIMWKKKNKGKKCLFVVDRQVESGLEWSIA